MTLVIRVILSQKFVRHWSLALHSIDLSKRQNHHSNYQKINSLIPTVEPHSLVKGGGGLEKNDG